MPMNKRGSHINCCVYGCHTMKGRDKNLSFHSFPKDKAHYILMTNKHGIQEKVDRKKAWEIKLLMGKPTTTFMRVCSLHFRDSDFILPGIPSKRPQLKKNAVPSLNLPSKSIVETKPRFRKQKIVENKDEDEEQPESSQITTEHKLNNLSGQERIAIDSLQQLINTRRNVEEKATQVKFGDILIPFISDIDTDSKLNSLIGKVKMTGCAVLGCSNKSEKGFLMKQFPKNPVRRKEWQLNMQRPGWIPTDTSYLCEVHFEPQMWEKTRIDGTRKLKNNAVPTLFSFPKKPSKRKAPKDKTQALTTMPNCQKSENGNEIFADPLNIEDNGTLQPPVKGEEILLDTLKIEPEDNETVPLALQGEEIFADTLKIEPEDNETDLALQGEEIFADTLKIEPEDNETVLALQGEEIFADTLKIEIKTEAEDNETVQAAIHVEEILTDTLKTENDEAVQQLVVEQAENTSILLNKVKQYRRDYQKLLLKYKYSQKCLRNARLKIKKLENTLKKRR